MQLLDLTIGTRHFYVPPEYDIVELEHRIEAAARVGGAMVDIPGPHGRSTAALITPATAVFVERVDAPAETGPGDEDDAATYDFDLHGGYDAWTE